jgi:hypothetical protein
MPSLDPLDYADQDERMPVHAEETQVSAVLVFYGPAVADGDTRERAEAVLPGDDGPARQVAFGMGGRFYLITAVSGASAATLSIEDPEAGPLALTRDEGSTYASVGRCASDAVGYEWSTRKPWERGEETRCALCGERGDHLTEDCTDPFTDPYYAPAASNGAAPGEQHAALAGPAAAGLAASAGTPAARPADAGTGQHGRPPRADMWRLRGNRHLIVWQEPGDPAAWSWGVWSRDPGQHGPLFHGQGDYPRRNAALAGALDELARRGIPCNPGTWHPAGKLAPARPVRKTRQAPPRRSPAR